MLFRSQLLIHCLSEKWCLQKPELRPQQNIIHLLISTLLENVVFSPIKKFYFYLTQHSSKAKQVINVRPTMSAAFTDTPSFKQISGIKNLSTQSLGKVSKITPLLYPLCIIIHHAMSLRIILNGMYLNSIMNSQDKCLSYCHTHTQSTKVLLQKVTKTALCTSDYAQHAVFIKCRVSKECTVINSTLLFRFLCTIPFSTWMQRYSKNQTNSLVLKVLIAATWTLESEEQY